MAITPAEIAETRGMVEEQNLDIRTITMGVSLMGCGDENLDRMCTKIYDHVTHTAEHLVETAENLEREYGIPIVNKRVSVTPVAQIAACCKDEDLTPIAHALDRAAETLGIDYLGGFSALVQKGIGDADRRVIQSIPQALATTSRVCSSVNVASLRAGINMDAVLMAALYGGLWMVTLLNPPVMSLFGRVLSPLVGIFLFILPVVLLVKIQGIKILKRPSYVFVLLTGILILFSFKLGTWLHQQAGG